MVLHVWEYQLQLLIDFFYCWSTSSTCITTHVRHTTWHTTRHASWHTSGSTSSSCIQLGYNWGTNLFNFFLLVIKLILFSCLVCVYPRNSFIAFILHSFLILF